MTVYRHRDNWMYDFLKDGRRQRKGGFPTKQEARMAETEARKNLKMMNSDFIVLCESRLKDLQIRRTPKYFQENYQFIKKLILIWGNLKEITRDNVDDYLHQVLKKSPFVANKHLRFIKALFQHGIDKEMISLNPTGKIKFFPISKEKKYIPPEKDVLKVLSLASAEQKLYLMTIINTIGRVGEINQLKWEDVKDDHLVLRTRKAKNSNLTERKIPINESLKKVLAEIPKNNEYIFIWKRTGKPFDYRKKFLKTLCKKAGVKPFGFHALRHFGATRLASAGVAITDIQNLLGHQRTTTTDIYLQSINESVKNAVKKLEVLG